MSKEQKSAKDILVEPRYDREGFVDYAHKGQTHKLWYGIIGSASKAPALVLHGGPGGNHHNLVSFQALADERGVIFYDQLGCGKSDRPDKQSLWTANRYFDEVRTIQDGLRLKQYHLIGHSWGTMQAVGFAAKYSKEILSVSLHSPILSFPYYIKHVAEKLKKGLNRPDKKFAQIIDDYELKRIGKKSDYDKACMEFIKKHVTHTWPLPEAMKRLIANRNTAIHDIMVRSGSELNVLGNLRTADVTLQLYQIDVPVLMTCGEDDLCTPAFTKWQTEFAKDIRSHVIQASAHMSPVDNPLELISLQRDFLREVEG